MTIDELLDVVAAKAAAEIVQELFGSSIHVLTATQRAAYLGEFVLHIRDSLALDLETAVGVIRAQQPTPSEWADRDEFDRIVEQFKATS